MNIDEEEQAIEGIYEEMWGKEPKDPRQRSELRKRAREKYYRLKEEEEEAENG